VSNQRRLLLAIGAAAGGIAAAAVVPLALAHADECSVGDCTLVSGGSPTEVVYSGFRPLFEDWKDDQATNVVVGNSSFTDGISGSYDVSEQDYSTALMDNAIYKFGAFTAAGDNPTGIDSGGLAGASVYDFTIGPGGKVVDGTTMYNLNDFNVFLGNGDHIEIDTEPGKYTNFLDVTPNGSGDWVETWGSTTPHLVWDSLTTSQFPSEVFNLANYLPPDAWFPQIDSMFPPGLT
jgi:hypothetical protein